MRASRPALLAFTIFALALRGADLDNDFVHVIDAIQQPHVVGPMHRHQYNRVLVYLDDADIAVTNQDGTKENQHWNAGQAVWAPAAGMHTSENTGAKPVHVIEVELKKSAPAHSSVRNAALDPVGIDAEHNILIFENPQVRVFRSWREPGATEKMHEHPGPGRLAVLLTSLEAQVKTLSGAPTKVRSSRGDVLWSGPVTHATTNTGAERLEMVVIEVK